MIAATVDPFGRLDVAFNNAGITGNTSTSIADANEVEFDEVMAVNVRGVWYATKYEFREIEMMKRGGGSVVICGSTAAIRGGARPHSDGACRTRRRDRQRGAVLVLGRRQLHYRRRIVRRRWDHNLGVITRRHSQSASAAARCGDALNDGYLATTSNRSGNRAMARWNGSGSCSISLAGTARLMLRSRSSRIR